MRSPTARQDEGKPVSAEPTSTGRIAVGGTALRRVRDAARTSVHPRRALRNGEVTVQRPGFRFALPGLGLYSVFVAYPAVATAYYAFTNWNGLAQHWHFIGLKNFVSVLSSGLERTAFANTFEATVGIALGANILGLVVALLLQKRSRFNYVLRLLWFLPAALPSIVAGYIWTFIYSPSGPLDKVWVFLHLGAPPGFLGSPKEALPSIIAIAIWQVSGYAMVLLLAGLQAIDEQLHEAARVDGAGVLQRLRFVTLPLLRPAFAVSFVFSTVTGLLLFDVVVATTDGGPGYATETLATQLYKQSFEYNNFGWGMAMGVLMGILVLGVSAAMLWIFNRKEARV